MSVTVTSGANGPYDMELAGQTVGQIRQSFAQALNIEEGARASLNGETVDDETEVEDGDQLDFVKATAEKGRPA